MKKTALKLIMFMVILLMMMVATQTLSAAPIPAEKSETPEKKITIRKLHYINAHNARSILVNYCSRYGRIKYVKETNSIIIEDLPAFNAKLSKMLDQIDIKPKDITFTISIVSGYKGPGSKGEIEKSLQKDPIIKQLLQTLKYNSFKNLGTSIVTVQDNSRSQHRLAENLELQLKPMISADNIQLSLELLKILGYGKDNAPLKTNILRTRLSLKNNEKTVVGVSKLNGDDKALILIISGKINKN